MINNKIKTSVVAAITWLLAGTLLIILREIKYDNLIHILEYIVLYGALFTLFVSAVSGFLSFKFLKLEGKPSNHTIFIIFFTMAVSFSGVLLAYISK